MGGQVLVHDVVLNDGPSSYRVWNHAGRGFFYDSLWKQNLDLAEWNGSDEAFELWYWKIFLRM